MTTYTNEIEILKIAINDEHHYRSMVQSRISYHTSIILALIALSSALSLRSDSFVNFFVISALGLLITYVSRQAITSIRRLYDHFIEAIRAREEIEVQLNIRDVNKYRVKTDTEPRIITHNDTKKVYWKYNEALLYGSWIPSGEKGGYFVRTQKTFSVFTFIGYGIFFFMLALSLIVGAQGKII